MTERQNDTEPPWELAGFYARTLLRWGRDTDYRGSLPLTLEVAFSHGSGRGSESKDPRERKRAAEGCLKVVEGMLNTGLVEYLDDLGDGKGFRVRLTAWGRVYADTTDHLAMLDPVLN